MVRHRTLSATAAMVSLRSALSNCASLAELGMLTDAIVKIHSCGKGGFGKSPSVLMRARLQPTNLVSTFVRARMAVLSDLRYLDHMRGIEKASLRSGGTTPFGRVGPTHQHCKPNSLEGELKLFV